QATGEHLQAQEVVRGPGGCSHCGGRLDPEGGRWFLGCVARAPVVKTGLSPGGAGGSQVVAAEPAGPAERPVHRDLFAGCAPEPGRVPGRERGSEVKLMRSNDDSPGLAVQVAEKLRNPVRLRGFVTGLMLLAGYLG